MKKLFSNHFAVALSLVAVTLFALTGAACSTTTETNTNSRTDNGNATVTSTPMSTPTPSGSMPGMSGMMKSSPNAASAPYDLQFLDTMTGHHQGAIDMARPAEQKAQHAELKTFAAKIVSDQQKEIAQMKAWRSQWYAGKPEAMNMEMPGMMDSMKGMDMKGMNAASGNEFDLMFLDMMTPHHTGAVAMAKEALTRAEHTEIKNLARQIIDAQEKEIAQMNKWKAAWGGAKTETVNSHKEGEHHDATTGHKPGDMHPPKP